MFEAKVLKDSISVSGHRLTTLRLTFPRFVLAELNTHRMFSRNASSSRAIPVTKMIKQVWNTPVVPVWFGKHQAGMQASEELAGKELFLAKTLWIAASKLACVVAWAMVKIGMHKQLANRVLEPFSWITVIVTATEWSNFFALRCHPDAQPELMKVATLARVAMFNSVPKLLKDKYHLPLVDDYEELLATGYTVADIVKICVGRCARVSYLTHDGKRDPSADIQLYDRLVGSGHLSPLEHAAFPTNDSVFYGNFRGWKQARKSLLNEDNFGKLINRVS